MAPLGVYGQAKAAGDLAATVAPRHYVLRTSWVIGDGGNFVRRHRDEHRRVCEQQDDLAATDPQRPAARQARSDRVHPARPAGCARQLPGAALRRPPGARYECRRPLDRLRL